MKRAYEPDDGFFHSICSEKCAELIFLDYVEDEEVVYPRSCEHCYRCGKLVRGTFENGCVIHFERHNPRGMYCPINDVTKTLRFEATVALVVELSSTPLSDGLWDYAADYVGNNAHIAPHSIAQLLIDCPELYE